MSGPVASADTLARLLGARQRASRRVIGIMSGTSADGADAALCEVTGSGADTRVRVEGFVELPFPPGLHRQVLRAGELTAGELSTLNFTLGEVFARAALEVVDRSGRSMDEVDLIASHGQTVSHRPPTPTHPGATLQIGEAAVIAERTGVPVMCDFRVRDVAAGGEGAPLVPLPDWILFRSATGARALQNIGGISNVTVVTPELADVFAFDNAPGNMELDLVTLEASRGSEPFDRDGARAARGTVDSTLLFELLAHPFLAAPPPKSTGREAFGQRFVRPLVARYPDRLDDLLATLTVFVAQAIRKSFLDFVEPRATISELLVSGGGVHNATLMRRLGEAFAPIPVRSIAALGMDPAAKEAVAFAVLGNEALFGHPGNLPAATGAAGSRVLGKLVL